MPEAAIWLLFTPTGLSSIPVFKHFPGLGHLAIIPFWESRERTRDKFRRKHLSVAVQKWNIPLMNVGLSQRENIQMKKKNYPDFAFNHFTPVTSVGYTGFLLQRQLNPAELICKLALVESLQVPEITGLCPKPTVIKVETWWKHYNLCVTTL